MTLKTRKTIVEPNFMVFMAEVVTLAVNGWELDVENPPIQFGVMYEANFLKDSDLVEAPKPTRAEILTTARAAKRAKAVEAPVEVPVEAPSEEQPPADQDGQLSDDVQQSDAPAEEPVKSEEPAAD